MTARALAFRSAAHHQPRRVTPIDPADYVRVIGSTFAKHEHAPLIAFGRVQLTRLDLARLGVPHTVAAGMLNRVLAELRITTIAGLAQEAHRIGQFKGCGVTVYWLVLALLRSHGYDVQAIHGESVTYATVKARARKTRKKGAK